MNRPETLRQAAAGLCAWKLQLLEQTNQPFDRTWLPTLADLDAAALAGGSWQPHEWAAATGATCIEDVHQVLRGLGYVAVNPETIEFAR